MQGFNLQSPISISISPISAPGFLFSGMIPMSKKASQGTRKGKEVGPKWGGLESGGARNVWWNVRVIFYYIQLLSSSVRPEWIVGAALLPLLD